MPKFKDDITLVISIAAFLMSGYTFLDNNFMNQHDLKASVLSINPKHDSLRCTVLLVNTGKSYETLYSGKFIFSDDLNKGGGFVSRESIGPIVIPPKQAIVVSLTTNTRNIVGQIVQETTPLTAKVHAGFLFDVIDKDGNLPEDGKVYKITQINFDSTEGDVCAKPLKGDDEGMISLLH